MRALMRLALGTAFAGGTLSGAALAQTDDFILLDTITLTASGEPVAVSRTGASVTVLTDEEIRRGGALSFGNLLAQQPGVTFDASGGPGTVSAVRIRGLGSAYVGARLDGFDVTDTSGIKFEFNFNTLGTSGLSRVEILRGSQSALYGSEAIAGVIDMTTWRPTGDGFTGMAGVETGTASTHTAEVGFGFLDDRVELAFSASRTVSDGGFSAWAGGTEDDGYDITTAAAYAAVQVTDTLRVGANLLWRESYGEFDDPYNFPPAEEGIYEDSFQRGVRIFSELETGAVRHELAYARLSNERASVEVAGTSSFDGDRDSLTYYGNWRANASLALNWGYEDTQETFVTDTTYGSDTGEVRTRAVHAEALWSPTGALDLSFALRHDEHSMFGSKTTGRVAAAWRPADGWTVRGVAGTGFRAPSLYELYNGSFGNEDLVPETSRSLELGVEREFSSGSSIQLTAFDIRIDDKIGFGSSGYEQVPGQTTSRGIELSARTPIGENWNLFGNYTYTDAQDDSGRAFKVPRHSLTLGVEGELTDRLSTALSLRYAADTVDMDSFDTYQIVPLPDYTLISTSFTYALDARTEATFRVENLFDQDYQTAHGYNQPGRQVFVGVRTSF